MAKLVAFLVLVCIEFSRQEEVVGKDLANVFPEKVSFFEVIHETYPLDIKLDDIEDEQLKSRSSRNVGDDNLVAQYEKVVSDIEEWMAKAHPSWSNHKWLKAVEKGTDAKCPEYYYDSKMPGFGKYTDTTKLWNDYAQVTLDVEEWMMKAHPSFMNYKWLKVVELGSIARGIIPKCTSKVSSNYDYYDKQDTDVLFSQPALDPEHQMWEQYIQVTLDIEGWVNKAYSSMALYKWLKVLEEGSVVKGTVPKCSTEIPSMFDYYDKDGQNFWIYNDNNNPMLMNEYNKLVTGIEKWMKTSHPDMSDRKWLKIIEKGTEASCPDFDMDNYSYYDIDVESLIGDGDPSEFENLGKPKFKRFTSV